MPGAATACPGRFVDMTALRRALGGRAKAPQPDAPVSGGRRDAPALPEIPAPLLWRVQAGAFQSREAAERQARRLRDLGIDALVVAPD
ncbi:SPOR domain-containing protein [Desulfoscipio geothermicus]|nr:SPOR domain-containing protein [Desulfoscipio geothermicus]